MHSKKMLHTFIFFLFPMPIISATSVYSASFMLYLISDNILNLIPVLMLLLLFYCYVSSLLSDREDYFKAKRKMISLKNEYFKDIPYDGNFDDIAYILLMLKLTTIKDLLITYFLKWSKEKTIIVNSKNREVQFIIKEPTHEMSVPEKELFLLMSLAAGKNKILTVNKIYKWEEFNFRKYISFKQPLIENSLKKMLEQEYLKETKKSCFIFFEKPAIVLTEKGIELTDNLIKLKNYLSNFTVQNKGKSPDMVIWDEYMIYAGLFGLSEDLERSFKNIFSTYSVMSCFSTDSVNSISKTLKKFNGSSFYSIFRNGHNYKYSGKYRGKKKYYWKP